MRWLRTIMLCGPCIAVWPYGAVAQVSAQATVCPADVPSTCITASGLRSASASSIGSARPEPTGRNTWDVEATAAADGLHVYASASNEGGFSFTPPYAVASGDARFSDTLSFSAAADVVEPISLTFVLALDGGCSGTGGSVNGFARSGGTAQDRLFGPPQLLLGQQRGGTTSTTIAWQTGAALSFITDLGVSGFATDGSFIGDFGDTSHVYVYSTTAGVTITSASGHDYALPAVAAVPEPSAAALMALGLGCVWLRGQRRGAARRAAA